MFVFNFIFAFKLTYIGLYIKKKQKNIFQIKEELSKNKISSQNILRV